MQHERDLPLCHIPLIMNLPKTSIHITLVEKSSKPAAPINYHWRFQLSRASKKNKVDPT